LTHKPVIIKKGRGKFFPKKYRMPVYQGHSVETGLQVYKSLKSNVIAEVRPPSYFRPGGDKRKRKDKRAQRPRFASADTVETLALDHEAEQAVAAEVHLPEVPSDQDLPALQLESANPSLQDLEHTQDALLDELATNPQAVEAVQTFFSEVKGLIRK